jgi:hypothetical protein
MYIRVKNAETLTSGIKQKQNLSVTYISIRVKNTETVPASTEV